MSLNRQVCNMEKPAEQPVLNNSVVFKLEFMF